MEYIFVWIQPSSNKQHDWRVHRGSVTVVSIMHVSGRGEHSRCQTLAYRWHCGGEWRALGFCSWPRRSSKDGTKSVCIICDQSPQLPSLLGRWSSVALSPSVDMIVVAVVYCCCYETHYKHILLNSVTDKIKEALASFCMDGINCSAECILLSPPPPRFFFFEQILSKICYWVELPAVNPLPSIKCCARGGVWGSGVGWVEGRKQWWKQSCAVSGNFKGSD